MSDDVVTPVRFALDNFPAWRKAVVDCRACECRKSATRPVPGGGNPLAKVVMLGQGPALEEDQSNRAFVGPMLAELRPWLRALGLDESRDVWMSYIVKCRLPKNRAPKVAESKFCRDRWLIGELESLPNLRVILTLGSPARQAILGKSEIAIGQATKGEVLVGGRKVVVFPLPHPASFLHTPGDRPYFLKTVLPMVSLALRDVLTCA